MISTKGMRVGVVLETLSHPLIKYWGDECARQGKGFVSDRIVVMRDGRIALEIDRASASEEVLLDAATGGLV
jgi:hypothetical protein